MPITYKIPADRAGWKQFTRAYLKALMLLRGYSYARLADELSSKFGLETNETQVRHLVNRGAFRAEFFLQAAAVMGIDMLEIPRFEGGSSESHGDDSGAA